MVAFSQQLHYNRLMKQRGCGRPGGGCGGWRTLNLDELVKSHSNRWLCKEAKFKARESRGVRRTYSTPQRQRDEAQRRNWPIYEAITIHSPAAPATGSCLC